MTTRSNKRGFLGEHMKTTFLKTGSFDEVEAVVKQLRSRSVKDQDTEKPVTKTMLKEVWKWDEYWAQKFEQHMHDHALVLVLNTIV